MLREQIEQAFHEDAEQRILRFLLEQELPDCGNDADRWRGLFAQCDRWRDSFLLWEAQTFVDGIHGWNLALGAYRLRPPEGPPGDWTQYLYRMTLLALISGMEPAEKNSLCAHGQSCSNFSSGLWFPDYSIESGFADLTRDQWLAEVNGLLERSWASYQAGPKNSPSYQREMERNYPKFADALEYLAQNVGDCEVVRMNQHGGDETVWYFVAAQDCFYLMYLSDSM